MATEIIMPKLSQTTEEVRLLKWLVREGDTVRKGDFLCEVETDKTTMEVETFESGVVLRLLADSDEEVAAGTLIAVIGEKGENWRETDSSQEATRRANVDPVGQRTAAADSNVDSSAFVKPVSIAKPASPGIHATRLVQNIASKKGINLDLVTGTGARGLITRKDLEDFEVRAVRAASVIEGTPSDHSPDNPGSFRKEPLTDNQLIVGQNLTRSAREIPHFYVSTQCCVDGLKRHRELCPQPDGSRISIGAYFTFFVARSLEKYPFLNAFFEQNEAAIYTHINIGFAVASGKQLFVPVVKYAETKDLAEIDQEMKLLISKSQDLALEPANVSDATFTITNLSIYPVDEFTAIISPKQAAVLAIGRMKKKVVVEKNDVTAIKTMCTITAGFDHRIVNGLEGAQFLKHLKRNLEELT